MKTISDHEWEECCLRHQLLAKISYAASKVTCKRDTPEEKDAAEKLDFWLKETEPFRRTIKISTDGDPLGLAS